MKFKTLFAVLIIAIVVIFSAQNAQATEVKFLVWSLSISRVLVILGSFVVGILVGLLLGINKRRIFSK